MLQRLLPFLLAAAAALAEEEDQNVLLSTALQRLKTADRVCAAVEVKHAPAEAAAAAPQGGAGGLIVQTGILGQHLPFEGRVEASRAADGTLVLLSEEELPGFALFSDGERTVERTTFEEDRFSLHQLRGELAALLEPPAFARRILDAKLAPTRDAATGAVTFRGKVSRDIVPPTDGDMPLLEGRVLGAEVTLVVSADGRLASASVKITRSDPTREMMRGPAFRRAIRIAGAGQAAPAPEEDEDRKHDIVGGSTTYSITFREAPMSDRAKAFQAEIERLLGAPGHGDPPPPGAGVEERK